MEVLDVVEHQEPAAKIDAAEAMEIVAVLNGSFVLRAVASVVSHDSDVDSQPDEEMFLCKLNRMTKELRQALCSGVPLRQCRAALDAEGHNWQLPSGALVFVQPWQYRSAIRALVSQDMDLRADHIILSSSVEHLIEETLEVSARGSGSWIKTRRHLQVGSVVASAPDSEKDEAIQLVVRHTFVCSARRRRPASEVTQSTTEVDSRKGLNPRRVQGDSL